MSKKGFTLAKILITLTKNKGGFIMNKKLNNNQTTGLTSMSRSKGFTLAEILITLTVIGVVAALTIPTLLQKTNDAELKTALKREYGNLSQAYLQLSAENAGIEAVFSGDGSASADANSMNAFLTKFSYIKNCGSGTGCWYNTKLRFLDGSTLTANRDSTWANGYGKAILADGSMTLINDFPGICNTVGGTGPLNEACGTFYIDVNGAKPPNTDGKDYFIFWITKTGVYPMGGNYDINTCVSNGNTEETCDGCAYKYLSE